MPNHFTTFDPFQGFQQQDLASVLSNFGPQVPGDRQPDAGQLLQAFTNQGSLMNALQSDPSQSFTNQASHEVGTITAQNEHCYTVLER